MHVFDLLTPPLAVETAGGESICVRADLVQCRLGLVRIWISADLVQCRFGFQTSSSAARKACAERQPTPTCSFNRCVSSRTPLASIEASPPVHPATAMTPVASRGGTAAA